MPPPEQAHERLLDLGCGGGLLAPHLPPGYHHMGVDLSEQALAIAKLHGVDETVQTDVATLPFEDESFDVVVAGEILEHVPDLPATIREATRVLKPRGALVVDTIADTRFAKLVLVDIAERLPGGPPLHCHDPALFVDPGDLKQLCRRGGVDLKLRGLRPHPLQYVAFLAGRRDAVDMVPTRPLNGVIQGFGRKLGSGQGGWAP